ncbi:MAG: hypothetical protein U1E11_08470 [Dethiobacteria bacterium]|nr:hypothetical protein [Dethiobacteria bacterium]
MFNARTGIVEQFQEKKTILCAAAPHYFEQVNNLVGIERISCLTEREKS